MNPRADLGDIRIGDAKRLAVIAVEAFGNIPRQFKMLFLIMTDGHEVCLIEQNVRGHQHRISEHPCADRLALFGGLILELRHALKLGFARDAVENPSEFRVFGHVRLNKDDRDLRIDP